MSRSWYILCRRCLSDGSFLEICCCEAINRIDALTSFPRSPRVQILRRPVPIAILITYAEMPPGEVHSFPGGSRLGISEPDFPIIWTHESHIVDA